MCSFVNRVPVLVIGALFFIGLSRPINGESLPEHLYQEGDWMNARREALRIQTSRLTTSNLLYLLSAHHLNPTDEVRTTQLITHLQQSPDSGWAAYEVGRSLWAEGNVASAYLLLKQSFLSAPDTRSFFLSAIALQYLLAEHPELAPPQDPIRIQLKSLRGRMPPALRDEARPPHVHRASLLTLPFRGGVAFYQTQIGPAIGQRCSMHPSCSRYTVEAFNTQGVLGLPMMADRLIRESDHVAHRIRPIQIDGTEKYEDPVRDHAGRWSTP